MKNWKKLAIFMLFATMLLLPGEVNADSISFSDPSIKNVCIAIAVIIIVLLLYLGYRLDSNDNTSTKVKQHKKNTSQKKSNEKANYIKKTKIEPIQDEYDLNDREYEEDIREYEGDNVNPDEISESIEYEEDDDFEENESFLNMVSNNSKEDFGSTRSFDSIDLKKELLNAKKNEKLNDDNLLDNDFEDIKEEEDDISVIPSIDEEDDISVTPSIDEEDDDFGDIFDTSIIDKIDEEDDDFGNIFDTSIIDKIDEEDNEEFGEEFDISIIDRIDEEDEEKLSNNNDGDNIDVNFVESSFIKELKNFKEPEIEFEGFSVGVADKKDGLLKQDNRNIKKYTRVKVKPESTEISDILDDDFLKQMEKNLEIGKSESIKKNTSTKKEIEKTAVKKSTRKKKVD